METYEKKEKRQFNKYDMAILRVDFASHTPTKGRAMPCGLVDCNTEKQHPLRSPARQTPINWIH